MDIVGGEVTSVHFDKKRMEEVIHNHELWWEEKLNRPLLKGTIYNAFSASHQSDLQ